ncbi:sugar ABC transporter ATP-binding protein [Aestuariivirga sp.]|uniref:sugar ABC transporter ATP-binding protein n=1 Tax=Aestuariivirga sp. TaxID=2650926 RepID=UPI0039E6FB9B
MSAAGTPAPAQAPDGGVPRLAIRNVVKTFPGVRAVDGVSLDVKRGEIHALIGENGAGKSTLMHMVAGVYKPDSGSIEIDGVSTANLDERGAADAGIAMVFQERSLVGALSVAENIYAGRQPSGRFGLIDRDAMYKGAARILAELDVDIDPRVAVDTLSPGQQQMVEIAKGLSHELKVIILDEPTSSLTIKEGRKLFDVIRRLASHGAAVVYVSHRMAEIFEISDRVTVLKDGRVTGVRDTKSVTHGELIALMVGRELSFEPDLRRVAADTPVALEVQDLVADPVGPLSFKLRYGEILCLAGLLGAGRTEVCEAIFGARRIQSGKVFVDGKPVSLANTMDAMRAGICMLPEDRKELGLFLDFSIAANIGAANLDAYTHSGLLSDAEIRKVSERHVKDLRIATPNIDRQVRNLSGGNQQKVMLAKWLARKPRILIVDEPTRGVDVGSKADIYRILRELASQGMALLVVSSDLPEVLALAHRIVVMAERQVAGEMDAAGATEISVLELAAPAAATPSPIGAA